ncbi:uncharacterized protein DSM5745_10745 [Aspergillus mulundensis]|uniref:Zn(2)-C6 fungal-type domain-containing protein n=1 Tax=Aspergillus mulundensis TaxID=1810919 RepID=A0A3D8QHN1_9EURO|nr:hypothetical protein DSM5745_10745 [Aspergillus mulundensis]RDW61247.1 hypothetical protein DSM5745_10745 [Aspergillus mulundensis]
MFSSTLMDEVMAQPFYPADDDVGFDAQSKREALSISHTLQSDSQHEVLDRNLGCISTEGDFEAKGRGATRRRIQVACMRCRKRKIKCSGDVGDGQGCSNCRSAGNTQCHFLRVNSSILQTKVHVPTGSGWPYPTNDMASRAYASSAASSKTGGFQMNHNNPRISPFSRASDYEVTPDTQNSYGRQPFGLDPTISYEDESSTPYNSQTSSATYMLPSSPQAFIADYCGLSWNSKNWGAILQGCRVPTEPIFSESDAGGALTHAPFPYMIPGLGQTNGAPSMALTQGSLPSPTQGTERTLPNPTGRNTFLGNNSGPVVTSDGLPSVHTYKSGNRWVTKCEPRTPMPSGSTMPFHHGIMDRAKLIPSNGNDMTFGFLPSGGATPPIMPPSSGSFAGLEAAPCAAEAGDELRGSTDARYRTFSRDNRRLVSHTDYRTDTYGYSRPAYRNRSMADDSNSESTLINGLPYTRSTHSVSLPQTDGKSVIQSMAAHPNFTGLCSQ